MLTPLAMCLLCYNQVMKKIYLVTGNPKKLKEWQAIVPGHIQLDTLDVDLPEIQSDDPEEIVVDKVKRAYEHVGEPVAVEDVSASLEKLGGLPGPFVKFFIKQLGAGALYKLAGGEGERATISCSVAYYDGREVVTVRGDIHGTIVAPRGREMPSFDMTFVPDGETETFAEMTPEKKNSLSHRNKAIHLFVEEIE